MKRIKQAQRGQALIVITAAAIALVAIVGVAVDGGAKFSDRRHAQNAADTAAMAAALAQVDAIVYAEAHGQSTAVGTCNSTTGGPYSTICTDLLLAALDRASSNGYDNFTNNTVEIYSPPKTGYYSTVANKAEYVQVVIKSQVPTTFMRVLGFTFTRNEVQAVAFGKKGGPLFKGAAFISVDPSPSCSGGNGSGGGSVDVSGNSTIKINGGGFFVNSNQSCGFSMPSCSVNLILAGGGGILSAGSNIYTKDNNTNADCLPSVPKDSTQRQYVVPDEIFMPKEPPECHQTAAAPTPLGGANWLIHPGYYTDFPQASLVPNNKNIYLESGVYCVDDDLSWSGSSFKMLNASTDSSKNPYSTYNPNGVTIYLKPGHNISLTINSPIHLDASTSGDYENYVIIQAGSQNDIRDCKFTGGQYLDLNGTVFAPYCDITINGDSSTVSQFNAQFVGWDLKIDGNNTINVNYDPDNTPQIKRKLGLMK